MILDRIVRSWIRRGALVARTDYVAPFPPPINPGRVLTARRWFLPDGTPITVERRHALTWEEFDA